MSDDKPGRPDRREFLKRVSAVAAAGATFPVSSRAADERAASHTSMRDYAAPAIDRPRFGIIGMGQRGKSLLPLLLAVPDAELKAICDVDPVSLREARLLLTVGGARDTDVHSGGEYAYRELLERDDIDAVIIATPWRWHAPMAIDAMQAGKHAFVEVPMATTIDDLWQMVEVSEATRRHCMMMENVCYGRDEMMVLNMVRLGLFGDLTHGEGAYIHDLRWQMHEIDRKTGSWRTRYHTTMRGNIYPTHGLGPIAEYMGINRGDRFDYMTSMSSPALGRAAYADREFPADHERNQLEFIKGDMNTTLLQTANGRSIVVQYDTTTARPYSRLNLIQGTGGAFAGYPNRIALENPPAEIQAIYDEEYEQQKASWESGGRKGQRPARQSFHRWDMDMQKWYARYDHPLWQSMRAAAETAGGHGGMDYMMLRRISQCLSDGIPLDQTVYDGAAWSSLFPLSHESVVARSKAVNIPDFTRGAWRSPPGSVAG
ncbi:MAG: Gfo/Idh/MocA family oxidoreductase [Pseudomonadota bacterium]